MSEKEIADSDDVCKFYGEYWGRSTEGQTHSEKHLIKGRLLYCPNCERSGCEEHFLSKEKCCDCHSNHP